MDNLLISNESLDSFLPLEIPDKIMNMEAKILLTSFCDDDNNPLVIKRFNNKNEVFIKNKLINIEYLMNIKKIIDIKDFVYPSALVIDKKEVLGFALPYINGENLKIIMENPDISFEKKKEYLIKIGNLLKKLKELRKEKELSGFYINDIHESNFIIDNNDNVKVIDLDSSKTKGGCTFPSLYLLDKKRLTEFTKYKLEKTNAYFAPQIKPNEETENFCFTIMLLNLLLDQRATLFTNEEYFKYITYLDNLGINKDLITVFRNLYSNNKNINPVDLISDLKENELTKAKHFYKSL